MEIKLGSVNDAKAVAAVEAACFPAAEAATETELTDRLRHYGSHFWLMWDGPECVCGADRHSPVSPWGAMCAHEH